MSENISKTPQLKISDKNVQKIYNALFQWRQETWVSDWKDDWPAYGPESLVSKFDLHVIAKKALTIKDIDYIDAVTSIVHLESLSPSLLIALHSAVHHVFGDRFEPEATSQVELAIPTKLQWQVTQGPEAF
ncbi:hypothetical protein BDQ17DRAFT_1250434 [Cyathus striatus]|nr:hypothetical protein BDQ17DRAFT_1250434 [Cyathus striatus]